MQHDSHWQLTHSVPSHCLLNSFKENKTTIGSAEKKKQIFFYCLARPSSPSLYEQMRYLYFKAQQKSVLLGCQRVSQQEILWNKTSQVWVSITSRSKAQWLSCRVVKRLRTLHHQPLQNTIMILMWGCQEHPYGKDNWL